MDKDWLENYLKHLIGNQIEFGYLSYILEQLGFNIIKNDRYNLKKFLKDGVCYYTLNDESKLKKENENIKYYKIKLNFDVLIWHYDYESENASIIKINDLRLELYNNS